MQGVKKYSKKKDIQHFKLLTKYIVTRDHHFLDALTNTYTNDFQTLINKAHSYFLIYPKLIQYLNTYLNQKFQPPLKKEFEKWLITFSTIAKMHNINNTNQLYYQKYKIQERHTFSQTIQQYYDAYNIVVSKNDIAAMFHLYCKNIISKTDFNDLKNIIDGKEHVTKSQMKVKQYIKFQPNKTNKFSAKIENFCSTVKKYIHNRPVCQSCPMYSKGSVILDTNVNDFGPVDIVIFGLNPGKNEYDAQRNFVGKSGQLMHKYFDILVNKYNLRYVILNSILCWSNNVSEIPNVPTILKNCRPIVDEIYKHFPAKIKILFGADAMRSVNIKGGITKLNGKMIDDYFIIFHPSAILRSPNKLSQFETAFLNLKQHIKNLDNMELNISSQQPQQFLIPEQSLISEFDKTLTLFDIQIVGDKVIYIMLDSNNNKKYLIQKAVIPIHLKSGNYQACDYFTDKIDVTINLSLEELKVLKQKLYFNVRNQMQIT